MHDVTLSGRLAKQNFDQMCLSVNATDPEQIRRAKTNLIPTMQLYDI